jgi:hypothetical protein
MSWLHSLEKIEQQMQTVLALIMAIFAGKAGKTENGPLTCFTNRRMT